MDTPYPYSSPDVVDRRRTGLGGLLANWGDWISDTVASLPENLVGLLKMASHDVTEAITPGHEGYYTDDVVKGIGDYVGATYGRGLSGLGEALYESPQPLLDAFGAFKLAGLVPKTGGMGVLSNEMGSIPLGKRQAGMRGSVGAPRGRWSPGQTMSDAAADMGLPPGRGMDVLTTGKVLEGLGRAATDPNDPFSGLAARHVDKLVGRIEKTSDLIDGLDEAGKRARSIKRLKAAGGRPVPHLPETPDIPEIDMEVLGNAGSGSLHQTLMSIDTAVRQGAPDVLQAKTWQAIRGELEKRSWALRTRDLTDEQLSDVIQRFTTAYLEGGEGITQEVIGRLQEVADIATYELWKRGKGRAL